jgi:hypothetical protein
MPKLLIGAGGRPYPCRARVADRRTVRTRPIDGMAGSIEI